MTPSLIHCHSYSDLSRVGGMEQLELLESMDTVSMKSYEVSALSSIDHRHTHTLLHTHSQSLLSLHAVQKCEWCKNNWKPLIIFLVIGLFIIVSWRGY